MNIEPLTEQPSPKTIKELCDLLRDCVDGGASIGFLSPLQPAEATAYWAKIFNDLQSGNRILLVSRETPSGQIIGSVQLACESRANGRHRAEVQKLMVLSSHRRKGIAAGLMVEIESLAKQRGIRLLFLDTSEGTGGARAFYEAEHYTYVGGIPGYAQDPDGTPAPNAIYYKTLS